jgi:excisionase family DNA binding protein
VIWRHFFALRTVSDASEKLAVSGQLERPRGTSMCQMRAKECAKEKERPMPDMMYEVPDLLYGAAKIADFLGVKRSVVYHLIETGRLPYFKVGKTVCARRSRLLAAMEQMEEQHVVG